jgi:aminoglycoside phosphotransferase (APT) family kinase protein
MSLSLPHAIIELLQKTYPAANIHQIRPTVGGYSNITVAFQLDTLPLILKAAHTPQKRSDLQHEAQLLQALHHSPLPIARVFGCISNEDWWLTLLQPLPGLQGIQYLTTPNASGELPDPIPLFRELAVVLAQLHQFAIPAGAEHLALPQYAAIQRPYLEALKLPAPWHAELDQSLAFIASSPRPHCLIHGDPGGHNLLWIPGTDRIAGLLDWEWAMLGDPIHDLAWVCWTLQFRAFAPSVRSAFLQAYAGNIPPANIIRQHYLAQIALILLRVQHQPAAYAEWLCRLEWTLGLAMG